MFTTIPYFNHKLYHQVVPDSRLQLCQQPPSPAGNPLELELISMELVPTVAGQQGVTPREDKV